MDAATKIENLDLIFKSLKTVKENNVKFALLKIDYCNATYSKGFSEADVKYRVMKESDDKHARVLSCHFTDLFNDGIKMLSDVENNHGNLEKLQAYERKAIVRLYDFFKDLGPHEASLKNVFGKSQVSETDITITLAEHLLGKLSPGDTYVIDRNAKGKGKCKCGCGVEPKFGSTGIGHEAVWHGHIDIVFSSHLGLPSSDFIAIKTIDKGETDVDAIEEEEDICCPVPEKKRKGEGDFEDTRLSPGGKSIAEVKHSTSRGAREQTIAQTIVFSLLQKQNHPNYKNFLVPNILISPERMQIVMYDADNDILLCSNKIKLFVNEKFNLGPGTLIIIWMVLHYRMFCTGLPIEKHPNLHEYRSHFKELVESKWDIYSKSLKSYVASFPEIEYEGFDFNEDFSWAKNIFE